MNTEGNLNSYSVLFLLLGKQQVSREERRKYGMETFCGRTEYDWKCIDSVGLLTLRRMVVVLVITHVSGLATAGQDKRPLPGEKRTRSLPWNNPTAWAKQLSKDEEYSVSSNCQSHF